MFGGGAVARMLSLYTSRFLRARPFLRHTGSLQAGEPCSVHVPEVDIYLKHHGGGDGSIGTISEILCDVGSRFDEDEEVASIETDKVVVSVRARHSGVVTAVRCCVGDEVKEGTLIYETMRHVAAKGMQGAGGGERFWKEEHQRRKEDAEREEAEEDDRIIDAWLRTMREAQRRADEKRRHESRRQQYHWQRWSGRGDASTSTGRGPWAVLGLKVGAPAKDIKAAFLKKAKKYHPDLNPSPLASKRFREVCEAYEAVKKR